jgi:hypothetical protein
MAHVDPETLALLALGDSGSDSGSDRNGRDAAHLSTCARCRDELRRLTDVVAIARDAGPDPDLRLVSPPGHVLDRITAELDLPEDDAPPARPVRRTPPWWRRPVAAVAAGMAACLLIGAAAAVIGEQVSRESHVVPAASSRLSPLPQFPQWRHARATATLRTGTNGPSISITLDASTRTGFFEVWLLGRDGRSMISLGDLNSGHTGQFSLPPRVNLEFYSRIDISLQSYNGSPAHSAISVVRGNVPGA